MHFGRGGEIRRLRLTFESERSIIINPHPDFEAWELAMITRLVNNGSRVIATPWPRPGCVGAFGRSWLIKPAFK
jgi:hypothetical protein